MLLGTFGFGYTLPGGVMIPKSDQLNKRDLGLIAIFGLFANIILIFIPLAILMQNTYFINLEYKLLLVSLMKINVLLLAMNIIPVSLLDGRKIFQWNKFIWISMVAITAFLIYILFNFI